MKSPSWHHRNNMPFTDNDSPGCQYEKKYEGYSWCNLSDNPCFKDTGECDEWNDFCKEMVNQ